MHVPKPAILLVLGLSGCAAPEAPRERLVSLSAVDPRIVVDARYATADNFLGRRLYPRNELFLLPDVARGLRRVQDRLEARGLGLKVLDAYRPLSVQRKMWEIVPDERYVADPAKGSRHNRGAAVDVTLVGADGVELDMPTPFDDFTERAHVDFDGLPPGVQANRDLLQEVMQAEGFRPIATEWWHFDAPGWRRHPVRDENPWDAPLFPDG